MSFNDDDALWRDFLDAWPIERLRSMTLPECVPLPTEAVAQFAQHERRMIQESASAYSAAA